MTDSFCITSVTLTKGKCVMSRVRFLKTTQMQETAGRNISGRNLSRRQDRSFDKDWTKDSLELGELATHWYKIISEVQPLWSSGAGFWNLTFILKNHIFHTCYWTRIIIFICRTSFMRERTGNRSTSIRHWFYLCTVKHNNMMLCLWVRHCGNCWLVQPDLGKQQLGFPLCLRNGQSFGWQQAAALQANTYWSRPSDCVWQCERCFQGTLGLWIKVELYAWMPQDILKLLPIKCVDLWTLHAAK